MKKIVAFILLTVLAFAAFATSLSAQAPEITPYYDNTQNAQTNFSVDSETHLARINVSYTGVPEKVSSISIRVRLQKKNPITSTWMTKEEWTDSTTQSSYINTFSKTVLIGQHKAIVEYTIYGTDGSTDVITHTIECTG